MSSEAVREHKEWPTDIGFSMAPFGYSTSARKTIESDTSVVYKCQQTEKGGFCPFQIAIDPRDMNLDFVKKLMRQHMDEAH